MKINVANIEYDLLKLDTDNILENKNYGFTGSQQIKIDTSSYANNQRLGITIVHELIHAIQTENAFEKQYGETEVTIMAKDLYASLAQLDLIKPFKRSKLN